MIGISYLNYATAPWVVPWHTLVMGQDSVPMSCHWSLYRRFWAGKMLRCRPRSKRRFLVLNDGGAPFIARDTLKSVQTAAGPFRCLYLRWGAFSGVPVGNTTRIPRTAALTKIWGWFVENLGLGRRGAVQAAFVFWVCLICKPHCSR